MRPAAYIRSSTSMVSGKKSNCSFGCLPAVVALSSMVSSSRNAATEPAACWANRPVSKRMVRVPNVPLSMTADALVAVGSDMGLLVLPSREFGWMEATDVR